MRVWVRYLVGLGFLALAAFGAYQAYAMTAAEQQCVDANHENGSAYHHVPLRA